MLIVVWVKGWINMIEEPRYYKYVIFDDRGITGLREDTPDDIREEYEKMKKWQEEHLDERL